MGNNNNILRLEELNWQQIDLYADSATALHEGKKLPGMPEKPRFATKLPFL